MHKKSLEAAEHFKNEDLNAANGNNSNTCSRDGYDMPMTYSEERDGSPINLAAKYPNMHVIDSQQQQQPTSQNKDRDDIRTSSIASLRAKAQEHCARLMGDSPAKQFPDPRKSQVLKDPNKPDLA